MGLFLNRHFRVLQPVLPESNSDIPWKRGKAMTAEEKPQKKSKGENRNEEQQPDQHPPGPGSHGQVQDAGCFRP